MISSFFTADYRDGRVVFVGKSYPAGVFATHLLGQFYINDTAARIAVFRDDLNYHILKQLNDGYLNVTEFVKTGANTLEALKALPKLRPFDGLNIEEIRNSVTTLFTAETGQKICEYFADKAKLSLLTQDEIAAGTADRMKTATDLTLIENNITEIKSILLFFDTLADHNNDWGKIHYTFGEVDYDVVQYVYADKKGDFFFACAGEWITQNTNRKHIPKYLVIAL